jgi:hypothetical protein
MIVAYGWFGIVALSVAALCYELDALLGLLQR